jgi:hypothetical protein
VFGCWGAAVDVGKLNGHKIKKTGEALALALKINAPQGLDVHLISEVDDMSEDEQKTFYSLSNECYSTFTPDMFPHFHILIIKLWLHLYAGS